MQIANYQEIWFNTSMVTSIKKKSSSSKSKDYLKTSDRKRPTWHFEVEGSGQRKRYLKSLIN